MSVRLFTRGYDQNIGEIGVSASVFVSGSRVVALQNGYVKQGNATNTDTFLGVAVEDVDNLDGGVGAKTVRFVKFPAEVSLKCSGSAAELVYGANMYTNATDSLVVSGSGVGKLVGTLQESEGGRTGFYWVSLKQS